MQLQLGPKPGRVGPLHWAAVIGGDGGEALTAAATHTVNVTALLTTT
jgi:hypothetical protein